MRQVADRLACAGFVSLRCNKRYVTGPTTVDRTKFDALNGSVLPRTAVPLSRLRAPVQDWPSSLSA